MIRRAALRRTVVPRRTVGFVPLVVLVAVAGAAVARSAEPGLSLRMTREELQRAWDLDRNGTIDEGEAAVAASKMRQQRARTRLRRIIDPVTGQLLDDGAGTSWGPFGADPSTPGAGRQPWFEDLGTPRRAASREWFDRWSLELEAAESAEAADPDPEAAAPSGRPRGLSLHGPIPGRPVTPTTAASDGERGSGRRSAVDGAAGLTAPRAWPTGGLRAGAEPARPGYGSGVTRDLNAGRPIDRTAGARAATTTGRGALRSPAGIGPVPAGGSTSPAAPARGRTPGRPYDPF